jgi:Chemotaxis protein CheC, inhibitor of MCP methylation
MAGIQFTELELDALKETMNIGFGQAARALSEVIDMHVIMNVPKIVTLAPEGIASFVRAEVAMPKGFSLIEQFFLGRFNGTSFLLLPESEARKFVKLFAADPELERSGLPLDSLEREIAVEIGNIIIGACVGKIAELLKDAVTYQPPRYFAGPIDDELLANQVSSSGGFALVFKTIFHFDVEDVYGFLFLVTGEDSAEWIKSAVDKMLSGLAG